MVVSRGYVQLVRYSGRPPAHRPAAPPLRPVPDVEFHEPDGQNGWDEASEGGDEGAAGEQEGADDELAPGRGDNGQSSRSRNNMRRLFASLPWELLGPRPP